MRVVVIDIIIENKESVTLVNEIPRQYGSCIMGRMGLLYEKKQVNIINVVVDAPGDTISTLSRRLGDIHGVSTKTLHSRV